jgi:hypothetical protein
LESQKYDQVQLAVGFAITDRTLRCQVLDPSDQVIIVTRGPNTDFAFADGGLHCNTALRGLGIVSVSFACLLALPTLAQIEFNYPRFTCAFFDAHILDRDDSLLHIVTMIHRPPPQNAHLTIAMVARRDISAIPPEVHSPERTST